MGWSDNEQSVAQLSSSQLLTALLNYTLTCCSHSILHMIRPLPVSHVQYDATQRGFVVGLSKFWLELFSCSLKTRK